MLTEPLDETLAPEENGPTKILSRYLADTSLDDIPAEILDRSNHLVLDGVACAIVGAKLPWSVNAVEAVAALEGEGPAAVIGWGMSLTPMAAATLNGTFIQGFELDDYHEKGPLHSCSIVLPAGFATADAVGSVSGADLALALALGFEVGPRLGIAMSAHDLIRNGWHCGAVFGGLAGAVTAAKVRGLDADQIEDTLGIAATQACGLMSAQFESMVKRMNHAFGSRNGVLAAALAAGGFTGIKGVLERPYGGMFSAFCPTHETQIDEVTDQLGERWELQRILVKPYASGGTTHPGVDAMLHARNDLGIRPDDIRSITIRLPQSSYRHNGWKLQRPTEPIGAQINIGYASAVALIDGAAFVQQFSPSRINADDVWDVLDRLTIIHDPEMDALVKTSDTPRAIRVDIVLLDGTEHHLEILEALGTKSRILTNEEIRTKYRRLVSDLIDGDRADEIERRVLSLHELTSAEDLIGLLRPTVKAQF